MLRSAVPFAMKEIPAKLAELPTPAEDLEE
jgi:hypothetical protein